MPTSDVVRQACIIIVIAGVTAGSTQSLQPSRLASMLYVIIAITPLFIWLILREFKPYLFLSVAIVTFILFMLITSHRGYNTIIETLRLRYEKTILADELMNTTKKLKLSNQTLTIEIKERQKIEDKLQYLATHDALTGLANRSYFETIFNQELYTAQHQNKQLGILYLDLDGFKLINDNYGHHIGDKLLIETAIRLRANIRSNDVVARFGGDEFLILLLDIPALDTITTVATALLKELEVPFLIDSRVLSISGSVGISIYPTDGEDATLLIKNADVGLYQAKVTGKSRWVLYSKTVANSRHT